MLTFYRDKTCPIKVTGIVDPFSSGSCSFFFFFRVWADAAGMDALHSSEEAHGKNFTGSLMKTNMAPKLVLHREVLTRKNNTGEQY